MSAVSLPQPERERWMPLRSGLLNLYRYDYEEFHFEKGRLLLRGNNGTGKSRILALQMPFLLDGEVTPARVEPDGDPAKRIEWNLLLGRLDDRTGYTWIEFGRRQPDGSAAFVTLGCGMRAVSGQPGLRGRWFFITSRRIGHDLFLQNAQGQPLGRERLEELLGAGGRVFSRAEDYRKSVDEALFGLGDRYGRLIELLIRLRRPQFSRKLEEEELSQTLSDALAVLPSGLIEVVAEAFRSLQADRDALRGFADMRSAAADFLREYRLYARVAVRRRAATVRSAHSAYEEAQRRFRDAERRLAEASEALDRLAERRARLDQDLASAEEAAKTLRSSPEMRTAEEIAQAEKTAEAAARTRQDAEEEETLAVKAMAEAQTRLAAAGKQAEAIEKKAEEQLRAADAWALEAEMADLHRAQLPSVAIRNWPSGFEAARAAQALDRGIQDRRQAAALVRRRETEAATAQAQFESAEAERKRADAACSAARDAEGAAQSAFENAAARLRDDYRAWHGALRILAAPTSEELEEPFGAWLERREGEDPLRQAAEVAHRDTIARIAAQSEQLRRGKREEEECLVALRREIEALSAGGATPPAVPPTRRATRERRAGAPLWKLCDFREDVPEPTRAGIEAALEASGILDAWVMPDGRVLSADTEDTFLSEADLRLPLPDHHAGDWLLPAIDPENPGAAAVSADTVAAILRRIGRGGDSGAHWIDADGSWRMGPLAGRWTKPDPEYVGESTREAARRRRLEGLRAEAAQRETACSRLGAELEALAEQRALADCERRLAPDNRPVLQAAFGVETAVRAFAEAFASHEAAEKAAGLKRGAAEAALRRLEADAQDLGLAGWIGRVPELEKVLSDYAATLAGLWPTLGHWVSEMRRLEDSRRMVSEAIALRDRRAERRRLVAEAAAAAASRFATLKEAHGASVEAVLGRLHAADDRIGVLKREIQIAQEERIGQVSRRTTAEGDQAHAEADRTRHESERVAAVAHLQRLSEHRLLGEADTGLSSIEPAGWTVTRAVDVAREIESRLSDTPADDDAWRRRQDTIHSHIQELRDRLITQGHQTEIHQLDDLSLVRCLFQGRAHTMTELNDAFAVEVSEREHLLAAREREIIENHLLGEVAVELQKLIRSAEEWVASANAELSARPTSTGLRFRFAWTALDEGGFSSVRRPFLRTSELWSPTERSSLAQFLQERIRAAQATDENGSWRDHLVTALDYRRWHRFVVERQQDGQWRRLDRRTYGTGSGGEKALALTLPRFAAAAAHYRSAAPSAPRLVLLDEAFAGIDPGMRAQCLGVLAQFDLDVIMTSENEWGCYPTVPGLAVYHLTAHPGIDAIAVTHWVWNGKERFRSEAALPPGRPPEKIAETVELMSLGKTGANGSA